MSYNPHTHYVNAHGNIQRIWRGHPYYDFVYSDEEKEMSKNYYRSDYRSERSEIDTSGLNVRVDDRVKFVMNDSNENRHDTAEAAVQAFGITKGMALGLFDTRGTVVCRPDQFGRFIVYRYNKVRGNQIRSLEPQLLPANSPKLLDVSRNF